MTKTPTPSNALREASAQIHDDIIIGAGVIGLVIAWRLANAGRRVLVVERHHPGAGASRAAAGMLAPLAEIDYVEREFLELKQRSMILWPSFAAELEALTGIDLDHRTHGTLMVAIDRDDAEDLRRHFDYRQSLGLPVQWLTGPQARQLEPYLSNRIQAAIDIPSDHQVDNLKLVDALTQAATRCGATILTQTTVSHINTDTQTPTAAVHPTHHPDQPHTTLRAKDNVILAAGCWSRRVGGLKPSHRPQVRPVKGQMFSVQMPQEHVLTRVVRAPEAYLVPRSDGRLIIGATCEEKGFDDRLTAGGLFDVLRGAYETLPIVYELEFLKTWVGLRPGTLDNEPIIARSQTPGVIFATGHYRNGILLTPVTGALVLEMVLGGWKGADGKVGETFTSP